MRAVSVRKLPERMPNFWTVQFAFLKTEFEPIFGFQHTLGILCTMLQILSVLRFADKLPWYCILDEAEKKAFWKKLKMFLFLFFF